MLATVLLTMGAGCATCCSLVLSPVVPALESAFASFAVEPLCESAFSDKLSNAALNVMAGWLTGTWAAGMEEEGVVVNKDAIRTSVMLHVVCQLGFFVSVVPYTDTADSRQLITYPLTSVWICECLPAIVAVPTGQWLPTWHSHSFSNVLESCHPTRIEQA